MALDRASYHHHNAVRNSVDFSLELSQVEIKKLYRLTAQAETVAK